MNRDYKLNVGEIFGSLCRHLSAAGLVDAASSDFMQLDTNLARVNYVYALLNQYKLFPNYDTTNWKNEDKSVKFREEGNACFKEKKNDKALEYYTKSIAYAKFGGDNLGLAYGNRSAVLFEQELYKECLQDIEHAFASNYPESTSEKLKKRRQRANRLSDIQEESRFFEDLPLFTQETNPHVACAANCISLDNTPEMGRFVIATKDIQIGDVIAIEKPYASIVLKEAASTHCSNCLKLCYHLVPCRNCSIAMFCSTDCMAEANDRFHKYECPIGEILAALGISKLNLIALRVSICAKDEYDNIEKFPRKKDVYESGRYEEIHDLCANTEYRTNADLFDRAVTAAIIYELVQRYTTFFDGLGDEKYKEIFKDILLHHMQTGPSNFHEISELLKDTGDIVNSAEIGAGSYSFLSMLNHSCSPNVVRHCHGCTIVLRALCPIKKGQQLFDNYGYHYAVMPKIERQKWIVDQYFFECNCEACVADWPLYPDLPIKNFEFAVSDEDMLRLQKGSLGTAARVLKGLLIKAAILDKMRPCKNLADIQECIKQCYSIFGNRRLM